MSGRRGQRGGGGGAGQRRVRKIDHANVDSLLGLPAGLLAPRVAAGRRVRHPTVRRLRARLAARRLRIDFHVLIMKYPNHYIILHANIADVIRLIKNQVPSIKITLQINKNLMSFYFVLLFTRIIK